MAISNKYMSQPKLVIGLDAMFNPSGVNQKFEVYTDSSYGAQIKKGESSAGNLYNSATTGSGTALVSLASNVVITVSAGSTGEAAVQEIRCVDDVPSTLYYIELSPAEEFLYQGTITITTATITINVTMS